MLKQEKEKPRYGYFAVFGKYPTFIETNRKKLTDTFYKDFLKKTSIPFNRSLGDEVILSRIKNHPHFNYWQPATCTPITYHYDLQTQQDFHKPPTEKVYDISTKNSFGSYPVKEVDYIIM